MATIAGMRCRTRRLVSRWGDLEERRGSPPPPRLGMRDSGCLQARLPGSGVMAGRECRRPDDRSSAGALWAAKVREWLRVRPCVDLDSARPGVTFRTRSHRRPGQRLHSGHDVYTGRTSAVAFRESGRFPDGATLVKELRVSWAGNYVPRRSSPSPPGRRRLGWLSRGRRSAASFRRPRRLRAASRTCPDRRRRRRCRCRRRCGSPLRSAGRWRRPRRGWAS